MKRTVAPVLLLALVFIASITFARDRNWQDATFLGVNSQNRGTATLPMGGGTVTLPVTSNNWWFHTETVDYCLYFRPHFGGHFPNLTINGSVSIAVEGNHVYVRDDSGKEWKGSIITKVAN